MGKQTHQTITNKVTFQSAIRDELRKSGIIGTITTQLRKQVFDTLNQSHHSPQLHTQHRCNLEQTAIRSLIMEYLTYDGLDQTASMLASESCFDDSFLSRRDALKAYTVLTNSPIHAMIMRTKHFEKEKELHCLNSCYEDTSIHILLSYVASQSMDKSKTSVSTQTTTIENSLKAREQLDRRLEMINEKYNKPPTSNYMHGHHNFGETIEAKLFTIQKECEERAREEMNQKLKHFQDNTVISMRKEEESKRQTELSLLRLQMQEEYDQRTKQFLKRQEDIKLSYESKEREKELDQMKMRQKMMNEMEKLKQREKYIQNELELERKKFQIEEQRIKQVQITAEAKLDFVEKKEKQMREDMTAEYDRIRSAAKQTFQDASDTAKKQSDFYSKELCELTSLRKAVSDNLGKSNLMEEEQLKLQVDRGTLKKELEASKKELSDLRLMIKEKDLKNREEEVKYKMKCKEFELYLSETQKALSNQKDKEAAQRQIHIDQKIELEKVLKTTQQQLRQAQCETKNTVIEKSILMTELEEIRILFKKSQEALICKRKATYTHQSFYNDNEFEANHIIRRHNNSRGIGEHINDVHSGREQFYTSQTISRMHNNAMKNRTDNEAIPTLIGNAQVEPVHNSRVIEAHLNTPTRPLNTITNKRLTDPNVDNCKSPNQRSNSMQDYNYKEKERSGQQEIKSQMHEVALSMIEHGENQDKDIGTPSVHSIATIMSLDLSPMKANNNKVFSPKDESIGKTQNKLTNVHHDEEIKGKPKEMPEKLQIEELSGQKTQDAKDSLPFKEHKEFTPKKDVHETTNAYDFSDFERESNNSRDEVKSHNQPSEIYDTTFEATAENNDETSNFVESTRQSVPFGVHEDTNNHSPSVKNEVMVPESNDKDSYEKQKSPNVILSNVMSESSENSISSRESYKSSSQFGSSSSAGIDVYSYKQSDTQSDWW